MLPYRCALVLGCLCLLAGQAWSKATRVRYPPMGPPKWSTQHQATALGRPPASELIEQCEERWRDTRLDHFSWVSLCYTQVLCGGAARTCLLWALPPWCAKGPTAAQWQAQDTPVVAATDGAAYFLPVQANTSTFSQR